MANITGQVTVDQLSIMEVDAAPGASTGTVAPLGSLAIFQNGTTSTAYLKNGTANTGWDQLVPLSLAQQAVFGAANLTTVGAVPFVISAGQLTQDSAFNWNNTVKALTIGPAGANLTNNPFSANGNATGIVQLNVQNLSAASTSSSDLVATADNGDDSSGYVNVGINSSANADPTYTIATARDSYVAANGGRLALGTEGAFDMKFFTGGTLAANEKMRIANGGQVVIGNSAPIDITGAGALPIFQIVGTVAVQMATIIYSADTLPAVQNLLKSRGATLGAQGLVLGGDEIGRIQFRASDGVNFQAAGAVRVQAELTPAAGSMPGRLNLWTTPSGSITPVERMRIDSTGYSTFFGIMSASAGLNLGNMTDTTAGNVRFNGLGIEFYRGNFWRDVTSQKVNFDDFMFTTLPTTAAANQNGWVNIAGTGGSAAIQAGVSLTAANGLIILNTGTTNNATGTGALDSFNSVNKMILGSTPYTIEWRLFIPVLSTATVGYQIRLGFQDTNTIGDPTNGVYFTYTHSLNSGNWVGVTRSAATSTSVNSTIPVGNNTWLKVRAEVNTNGTQVDFWVDNGSGTWQLIGSSTTNIPTAALRPIAKINKTTTSAVNSTTNVDYCLWLQER